MGGVRVIKSAYSEYLRENERFTFLNTEVVVLAGFVIILLIEQVSGQ